MDLRLLLTSATIVAAAAAVGCGQPPAKSGSEGSRNSFTYEPDPTANNGGGGGGGTGSGGSVEGLEQGSPESEVRAAFDKVLPPLCGYDQSCDDPTFGGMCPTYDQYVQFAPLNCWVVDATQVDICAQELQGLQCVGQYENVPASCQIALRPCQCLDGYEQEFIGDELGCYAVCSSNDECKSGQGCYDGICREPQEGDCAPDQVRAAVNGEEGCYDVCDGDGACGDGFVCTSGICIQEA